MAIFKKKDKATKESRDQGARSPTNTPSTGSHAYVSES
jgi:hypothetical protein